MTDQPPTATGASTPPSGFYPDPDGSGTERFWDGTAWTEHTKAAAGAAPSHLSAPTGPPKKKKRIFMWFFLIIQALFLIWIIAGIAGASGPAADCGSLDAETCNDASDAGTAIGVALVFVFWAVVDIILGFIYLVIRLARR